jgi:hypothetical protein
MAWEQLSLGILEEFAKCQQRFGALEQVRGHETRMRERHLAANRQRVDRWNAAHVELRRQRQRIYDARNYAKQKAAKALSARRAA